MDQFNQNMPLIADVIQSFGIMPIVLMGFVIWAGKLAYQAVK